jgi:O-antigen ligase
MLIWENAFANFKKYPIFGQGFMTYYMISKDKIFYPHSHNIVLDYFLNFGVVGVASLAVYLGSHLIYSLKRIFQNPVCSIVIAVTVTTLVHGMTDVPTSAIQSGGLFIVYFSLAGTFKKPENTLETSKA